MALTRAPDGLLGRRPALDIRRIVEAHQVGRPLVRPDPQLPAVAAQARVGRTLRVIAASMRIGTSCNHSRIEAHARAALPWGEWSLSRKARAGFPE